MRYDVWQESPMKVALDTVSGVLIVRLSGDMRIWGYERHQERLLTLLRAQETPPKRMILNLAAVQHMDTAGVGALAGAVADRRHEDRD
jgi:anti-anti-sigma factor